MLPGGNTLLASIPLILPIPFLWLLSPHYKVCKQDVCLDKPRWESLSKCPTKHFAEPQLWHMYFSLKRIMLLEDLPLLCFGHQGINSWTRNGMTVVREFCKQGNQGYQWFNVHGYSGQRALSCGALGFLSLMESEPIKLIHIYFSLFCISICSWWVYSCPGVDTSV